jgi:Flp pilus assembly protein TadG
MKNITFSSGGASMFSISKRRLRRFARETKGNAALLFGIAVIPLVLGIGVAVDYGRAMIVNERLQAALDSAGLAVGSWVGLSPADMEIKAQQYFDANYPPSTIGSASTINISSTGNEIHISASADLPTTFMKLAHINSISVKAESTIAIGRGTVEVALALDNSGSMSGSKISALKTAASNLVDTLFSSAQYSSKPDPIKVSVVPFAASVNVGPQYANASWMDTTGEGKYNAYEIKCYANGGTLNSSGVCSVNVGTAINNFALFSSLRTSSGADVTWAGCVEARPDPYDVTDDAPSTGNSSTLVVPMFAPDEPDNWTFSTSGSNACPYGGTSSSNRVFNGAPAGSYSYNNYLADAGNPNTCASEFPTVSSVSASTDVITTSAATAPSSQTPLIFQSTGSLPSGLNGNTVYYVTSPSGKDFKVSTTSGGSAVNITGTGSGTLRYAFAANWTCQSGNANCGGTNFGKSERSGFAGTNVSGEAQCKYGTAANKATVTNVTVGGIPAGPNFMCTSTPLLPLSTDQATVESAINAMGAQGATSIMEGAIWGWRTLSPGEPFTEGRPYGTEENQKVLVLMTDGQNTYYPNSKFLKSWYEIYGYVARGQLGTTSTDQPTLTQAMDNRTKLACDNIKGAGVIVYTVAFQIPGDQAGALDLLKYCATDDDKYYAPNTESELLSAFSAIGQDISELRIAQ